MVGKNPGLGILRIVLLTLYLILRVLLFGGG